MSLRLALASAIGTLIITACAGSSADSGLLEIAVDDFEFRPSAVTAASGDVQVEVRNVGGVDHNWTVLQPGAVIITSSEFEASMALVVVDVAPRAVETASFNLPPGPYVVICTVPGHLEAGMKGELTIGG